MKSGEYFPTIGLEIHAELKTETKMFCSSKNSPHDGGVNEHVCPVCMGHPGTLPVVNKKAVESVIMVGLAMEGEIAEYTEFNRKNYFYPDIPKGYQISQDEYPLVTGGSLAGVEITRIHLEEDTARSAHRGDTSLLDFNRAGVPLMELVTEPVIHDAETAGTFAKELQLLLRTLGVSDAQMERGEMRVEANISISKDPNVFGTKVEVKNLNSFKAVESAISYEIERQKEALEKGELVVQETRGWDENKNKTFSQRKKESAHDYRYFPEPDIPSINLAISDEISLSRLSEIMPKLPNNKRVEYKNIGLKENIVNDLVSNIELDTFFQSVLEIELVKENKEIAVLSANYLISDGVNILQNNRIETSSKEHFARLMSMVNEEKITSRVAKDLLEEVLCDNEDPEELAVSRNLIQVHDTGALEAVVDEVIREHTSAVEEYKGGKETAIQFLIGQGMKKTQGSANPGSLKKLFEEKLK